MSRGVGAATPKLKPLVRAAVQNGNLPLIVDYLASGGEIDARDQRGRTALMLAASRGHRELCLLLLKHGADEFVRDDEGQSALEIARHEGMQAVVLLFESRSSPSSVVLPSTESEQSGSTLFVSWLPEDETEVPAEDLAVRRQVLESQGVLLARPPVDRDADWSDLEIDLPYVESLEIDKELQRDGVQDLLLALIGEARQRGAYRPSLVEAVAREMDGTSDGDAYHQVTQMLGEIGTIQEEDEDGWGYGCPVGEQWESDDVSEDCLQFLKGLQSLTNDAYEHLKRDVRLSVLLDREEEERIGRMIALAIKDACRALGSDSRVLPILMKLHSQVLMNPYLASKLSRSEEGAEDDDAESQDEEARTGNTPGSTNKFSSLLKEAIQAFESPAVSDKGKLETVERLELTVEGMRAFQRGMDALGYRNEQLNIAIERATRLEQEMFSANVRLAISVVGKYGWSKIPRMDLIQEAYTGLIKAIERFDFERGTKFSTYAIWWLRQSVTRAIADKERAIRVPVHMMEKVSRLASTARSAGFDSPKVMPVALLSALSNMTDVEVRKTLSVVEDASPWDDCPEDLEAAMSVADTSESPLAYAERMQMERIVRECVDNLPGRDADIIRHRFGLVETGEKTLEEVGQLYDVTRERIRQIEAKALRKLSNPMNRIAVLKDYIPECG